MKDPSNFRPEDAEAPEAVTSEFELLRAGTDAKRDVLSLAAHLWSPYSALNSAYFDWKYLDNPYQSPPLVYLAMHRGAAVAMRGFFGMKLEGGNPRRSFTCLQADDMVVRPEYRNRGLVARIMRFAFADLARMGHEYAFSLSAGPVTFLLSLSIGWRSAGPCLPLERQPWRRAARSGLIRFARRSATVSRVLDEVRSRGHGPRPPSFTDGSLTRVVPASRGAASVAIGEAPRLVDMSELVERVDYDGRLRAVRDAEYFGWRLRNPFSRYRYLYVDEDRLEGYLVLQEYASPAADHGVVNIVDWEASRPEFLARLLDVAIAAAQPRRLLIWSATLRTHVLELLRNRAFRPEPMATNIAHAAPSLLVRSLRDDPPARWMVAGRSLLDAASWDLRMLDSMRG